MNAQQAVADILKNSPFYAEMKPLDLAAALDNFWSQVAMNVKVTTKDAQLQGIYAVLFSQVRKECSRVAWQDDPVVYTRVARRSVPKETSVILLVAAAVLMLLTTFLLEGKKYTLGMILCGLALVLLVAGIALQTLKGEDATHIVEQRLRPAAIAKSLDETASAIDSNARTLLGLINPVNTSSGLEALDLVCELYRSRAHKNANVQTELARYLRQNGVREVAYSEETAAMFSIMPSNATETLQPALVQETATGDHLLAKGVACLQMIK